MLIKAEVLKPFSMQENSSGQEGAWNLLVRRSY